MKAKLYNDTYIEGFVYQHNLETRVTGENSKNPGTTYIRGSVDIATDDNMTNIVTVYYRYVTEKTAKGTADSRFAALNDIINGKLGTVMGDGKDKAAHVRVNSSVGLNEFFSDRSGTEELVSAKRNDGGFIHTNGPWRTDENERNTFDTDMVITGVKTATQEINGEEIEKAIVSGYVFGYAKNALKSALLPVSFSAVNPNAISYFEGLNATEKAPVFTRVKGRQISETVVRTIEEESAFGDAQVREVRSNRKDWVITWAKPVPYEWDDESSMTVAEFKELLANRETTIATLRQSQADYQASKGNAIKAAAPAIKKGDFDF